MTRTHTQQHSATPVSCPGASSHAGRKRGFTMVELLTVIAILAILMAILVPALLGARSANTRAQSIRNLQQVSQWMQLYSQDNKTFVLPSRFDYQGASYPGKTVSEPDSRADQFVGQWSDILWAQYADTAFPSARSAFGHDFTYEAPSDALLRQIPDLDAAPVRAAKENSRNNRDVPGYFAANDFFNADPDHAEFNGWFTTAQIADPDRSLYLVDSFAGEVIADEEDAWDMAGGTGEVDFRYEGEALMLFMDGSVRGESLFDDLTELRDQRDVKVQNLDRR